MLKSIEFSKNLVLLLEKTDFAENPVVAPVAVARLLEQHGIIAKPGFRSVTDASDKRTRKAFFLIVAGRIVGMGGQMGWKEVCASAAVSDRYYSANSYQVLDIFDTKEWPASDEEKIVDLMVKLKSRLDHQILDAAIPPAPASPARAPRL